VRVRGPQFGPQAAFEQWIRDQVAEALRAVGEAVDFLAYSLTKTGHFFSGRAATIPHSN
jgi:hypothetical protein